MKIRNKYCTKVVSYALLKSYIENLNRERNGIARNVSAVRGKSRSTTLSLIYLGELYLLSEIDESDHCNVY